MTICLITTNPQETAEQYQTVMSHVRDSGPVPPEGARLLIAGQGPEGWRTVSVWDDAEAGARAPGPSLERARRRPGPDSLEEAHMLHPALARALASAHIDDLHRAAARWHTIRLADRAAHAPRVAATSTAIQRPASESAAWISCAPATGTTPTETAHPASRPCQSVADVPTGPRAGIDLVSRPS